MQEKKFFMVVRVIEQTFIDIEAVDKIDAIQKSDKMKPTEEKEVSNDAYQQPHKYSSNK